MGITERKEREKQEMRDKIIDAAISMFLEEGYEKTSIRNIAEKIEYSPATIYLYYKDKDELLYDVQKQAFGKLDDVFREKITAADPFERLEQICHTYVWFGINNPELYDLMFIIKAPMNAIDDNEWHNGDQALNALIGCVTECLSKQEIRFSDPRVAALSIWSMGHGLISLNIRCRIKEELIGDMGKEEIINKCISDYVQLIKK